MIAVDTNILVRIFVADDELQTARATKLVASQNSIYVPKSVVLEFVWVLSAVYSVPRETLIESLRTLAGLERFEIEDRTTVEQAIELFADGYDDFADALHVCSSGRAVAFATFDRKLIAKARKLGSPTSVRLP